MPFLNLLIGLLAGGLTLVAVLGVQLAGKWVRVTFVGFPADRGRWLRNTAIITTFSVLEELAFRLLMILVLQRYLSTDLAVVISSIAFGLVHALNVRDPVRWIFALEASLAGLWFGYAFVVSGSIALAFGLHVGWNLAMWQIFGCPEVGWRMGFEGIFKTRATEPGLLSGGECGPEASLPAMFADLVWVVALRSML